MPLWEMTDDGFIRKEHSVPDKESRKQIGVRLCKALMKAKR